MDPNLTLQDLLSLRSHSLDDQLQKFFLGLLLLFFTLKFSIYYILSNTYFALYGISTYFVVLLYALILIQ